MDMSTARAAILIRSMVPIKQMIQFNQSGFAKALALRPLALDFPAGSGEALAVGFAQSGAAFAIACSESACSAAIHRLRARQKRRVPVEPLDE